MDPDSLSSIVYNIFPEARYSMCNSNWKFFVKILSTPGIKNEP